MSAGKSLKRGISLFLVLCFMMGMGAFNAVAEDSPGVKSVRAITDMGWWGQRVIGVVLEFDEDVDVSELTTKDFKVRDTSFNPYFDTGDALDPGFMRDQTVTDVFTVADPSLLLDEKRPAAAGKYLVVMVEPSFNGGTKISVNGGMTFNPNQPTEITLCRDVFSVSGRLLAAANEKALKLTGQAVVNRSIDKYMHGVFENPAVGVALNYDYRLPENYDETKKYPLVVFFNGNGQGYFPEADNLRGELICDGTVTFWFNEQDVPCPEDVIFLAPQSTRTGQSTAVQAEQAAELIERFSQEFAVDTDRVYAYSLSMGSAVEWWLAQYRSDLFAAIIQTSFMPNNQAQADAIARAELPVWMFQGQYDHLLGSENAIASYQRIVDAYRLRGLSDERIAELVKITVYPDSAFEAQGPGEHTPSGRMASLNPDLPGPRIDRHAALVPALQDPATTQWLFAQRKAEKRQEGPIVKEDAESPTGYSVTFVYKNETADAVRLAGDLTLLETGDADKNRYEPEEWKTGRYHTGGVEFLRDMTKDEDGYWTVTIPMHAGGLSFWYRVDDAGRGWENKRIWDPNSTNPRPAGDASFRVLNNDVLDTVYVPYAEKQNDETLAKRAAYETPLSAISSRGAVQYVKYTNVLGEEGYLGVYLPAGYSAWGTQTYKTVYLAHGIFGDETDWMIPGNAPNIMDHLIANGEIEATILVTMGNHFSPATKEGGLPAYDMKNAATNLVEAIIPYMEAHYKVSTEPADRAYCGFSMGGMTGGAVFQSYSDQFGYFGFFSGTPRVEIETLTASVTGKAPFVFLGNGTFESDMSRLEQIRDAFIQGNVSAVATQTIGAHDMTTAGRLFLEFAQKYLWK